MPQASPALRPSSPPRKRVCPEHLPPSWGDTDIPVEDLVRYQRALNVLRPRPQPTRRRVIDWGALSWIGFAVGCLGLAWLTAHTRF